MAVFPSLKTGAVSQYPSGRTRTFSTHVLRFLDGTEQRFSKSASSLKTWTVRFERLDEDELQRVDNFFVEQGGAFGMFSFTDPWDGTLHANCSFQGDSSTQTLRGWADGSGELVIVENR